MLFRSQRSKNAKKPDAEIAKYAKIEDFLGHRNRHVSLNFGFFKAFFPTLLRANTEPSSSLSSLSPKSPKWNTAFSESFEALEHRTLAADDCRANKEMSIACD